MRTVPSDIIRSTAKYLGELVARAAIVPVSSLHFEQNWDDLWNDLVAGGWLAPHAAYDERPTEQEFLVDLAYLIERWSRYLVPLPLSEAFLLSWMGLPIRAIATPAGVPGRSYVAYPERLGGHDSGKGLDIDDFAPSRLIAAIDGPPSGDPENHLHNGLATLWASEAVGCASAALELAVQYSRERHAYGRPIGSFQALRHLLVDMHIDVELARSAVVQSVYDDPIGSAIAASDRSRDAISGAIQVYGGMGFTWEAGLHYYLRHVMAVDKLLNGLNSQDVQLMMDSHGGSLRPP